MRLLQLTALTSALDRATIAPLILLIARDLHRSVEAVTLVATCYFFAYGAMQLVWAVVSDRLGRVPTMRLSLVLACVAGLASAVAPGLGPLLVARALTGAAFAAAVPGALIYIGDTVPMRLRHGVLADLATGTALGLAIGTLGAAVVGEHVGWRAAFAATAVAAGVLAVLIAQLPEPQRAPAEPLLARLPALVRSRGTLLVLGLAWLEGFAVLGFLVLLPTVLQVAGASTSVSGFVVAFFGVAVVAAAAVVKRLSRSRSPAAIMGAGGCCVVASYALLMITPGFRSVFVACALLGVAWALMHTGLQAWATDVAPAARGLVVAAFAAMLFIGNAAGTFVGGRVLADAGVRPLFLLATVGRSRYAG